MQAVNTDWGNYAMNFLSKSAVIVLALFSNSLLAAESDEVLFERIEHVTVKNLWSLTAAPPIVSKRGAVIAYWAFDEENRPIRGNWSAIGIVLAGFGDIGEIPVGVIVWARQPAELLTDESRERTLETGLVHAVFKSSNCLSNQKCDATKFYLVMEDDGDITSNGRLIGSVGYGVEK